MAEWVKWRVVDAAGNVLQDGQALVTRDRGGVDVTALPALAAGQVLEIEPLDGVPT